MFVPLLPGTYDLLLTLLGLTPARWHSAQIVFVFSAALSWYLALRLWFPIRLALVGTILFLSGVPMCSLAAEPMLMHYLESFTLGALSTICYVLALRRSSNWFAILSAVAYLAAILAKEIVVPLPAILLLLPENSVRNRLLNLIPAGVAMATYVVWRVILLGTSVGGYGWAVTARDIPALLVSLPLKFLHAVGGPRSSVAAILIAVIATGAAIALWKRRLFLVTGTTLVLAIAPIIPVSKEMQPRYALMTWALLCVLFVVGCGALRNMAASKLLAFAGITIALVANRQEWRHEYANDLRMSIEGKAFLELPPNALLRNPMVPSAAMGELRWLREQHLRLGPSPGWFYDDLFLCLNAGEQQIWSFDSHARKVVNVTSPMRIERQRYCGAVTDLPLSITFRYRDGVLSWHFGPYRDGSWRIVIGGGAIAFDVASQDGVRFPDFPGMSLRARYTSPKGAITYSPELPLSFAKGSDFEWHR